MEWLIYGVKEKDGINLWSKGEGWNESREKEKSKDKEEREYKEGKEREWNQKSANKTEEGRGVVIIKWECERCGALKSLEQQGGVG